LTYIFGTDKVMPSQLCEGYVMKRYRTLAAMLEAFKCGEIPRNVISPGAAAAVLGVTRQTVHDLCKRGVLPAWYAERVTLIDRRAVQARLLKARGVPDSQGDLYAIE
jgi:hypothetical protein